MAPWNELDRKNWFSGQRPERNYRTDIVARIDSLRDRFDVQQYGALCIDPSRFPLFLIRSRAYDSRKLNVLITGGVHGYETSGVLGALEFFDTECARYSDRFNLIGAPCISPWSYETVNRWNPGAVDPNRSFYEGSPAEECSLLLKAIAADRDAIDVHFDLHETTDTDNTVFRPALAERDGVMKEFSPIPDGFYTVGDSENPQPEFERAIIESVERVTHIAPADPKGEIIGSKAVDRGVIYYPMKELHLCGGITRARYSTTTEVYPDSPRATPEICIAAQVAAIRGGLDYVRRIEK